MSVLQQKDQKLTSVLLFGDTPLNNSKNTFILDATIDFIILTIGFDEPLFNSSWRNFLSITLLMKSCIQHSYKIFIQNYLHSCSPLDYFYDFLVYNGFMTFFFFSQTYQYIYINNCKQLQTTVSSTLIARVLNMNVEHTISIWKKLKLTQVSNCQLHVYTFIRVTICEMLNTNFT